LSPAWLLQSPGPAGKIIVESVYLDTGPQY